MQGPRYEGHPGYKAAWIVRRGGHRLSAISTYIGSEARWLTMWVVRTDLMGIIREDLVYSVGAHVDQSVHDFRIGPAHLAEDNENHRGRPGRQRREACPAERRRRCCRSAAGSA
jgi:adenylylsulfate reductase subunit A